ncbi:MAG: hypothetical protein D6801_04440, partial [Alphaproteobacteria bacterium]
MVGALLGLVAFLLIGGLWGLIVGIVLAVVLALVLRRVFCADYGVAPLDVPVVGRDSAVETGASLSDAVAHPTQADEAAEAAVSALMG